MRIAIFAASAVIIATQIGCAWWAVRAVDRLLSPVYYNTSYVKLAADEWESGQASVKCK